MDDHLLKKRALVLGAVAALMSGVIGLAAPVQAASGFVMPNIDGMNLQEAEDAVSAAAHGIPLHMHSHNIKGIPQRQLSLADWLVCEQVPAAGEKIASATDVNFGVVREFDAARNKWDDMVAHACD
ncbi:hypothetical protein V4U86_23610 [Mycobacterium sp. AMU20-3851]|uniref:hypothetical protein n=1 Tax=Mycobacterium sp. AMU20-3851 TaxID=3122055 RepID=UPI003754C1E9